MPDAGQTAGLIDGTGRRILYRVGGITILLTAIVALAEIAIGFLPGAPQLAPHMSVVQWFALFHEHPFFGLRQLGLLNLIGGVLLAPTFVAIWAALRRDSPVLGAGGTVLFFAGITIYLADNRAFAMLSLSDQFATAASQAQRLALIAAGQSVVAEAGNRLGLMIVELATMAVSAAMLRGSPFGKAAGGAGILGSLLLLVFEILLRLSPDSFQTAIWIAIPGGLLTMIWYVEVGRRLLRGGITIPSA